MSLFQKTSISADLGATTASRALRILYVVNGNGLSTELGGSVVRSSNVAKRIAAAGNAVTLMATSGGLSACRKLGLEVPTVLVRCAFLETKERSIASRLWGYLISSVHGMILALTLPRFDWVYTDSDYPCDVLPAFVLSLFRRTRWVAMIHHMLGQGAGRADRAAGAKRFLQNVMHAVIAKRADVVFCYATAAGDSVQRELVKRGMDSHRIYRVHNGFDPDELARASPTIGNRYEACLLGGLRPGKGLREVVPIWKRVCSAFPKARLILVGNTLSHYEEELRFSILEASLESNIVIAGPKEHSDAIALLKSSLMMISPSLEEGWGIAVCESLACGVPVVAYDLPAYKALFAGGMRRVAVGDALAFADAVTMLLAGEEVRNSLATEGRCAVQNYDWNVVATRDLQLMKECSDNLN